MNQRTSRITSPATCGTTRNGRWRSDIGIVLVVLLALLTSCGAPIRVYTHPEADMAFYTRVGVLPFTALAADRLAGEKFGIEFTTALLASQKFEVVEYGVFLNQVIRAIGSRPPADGLSKEHLQKIAEATGVEGVFLGSVMQYDMVATSSGTFPVISVEARLVDTQTGIVAWQSSMTERGGPKTPIIGFGEIHTLGELAQKMSKAMVKKIQ